MASQHIKRSTPPPAATGLGTRKLCVTKPLNRPRITVTYSWNRKDGLVTSLGLLSVPALPLLPTFWSTRTSLLYRNMTCAPSSHPLQLMSESETSALALRLEGRGEGIKLSSQVQIGVLDLSLPASTNTFEICSKPLRACPALLCRHTCNCLPMLPSRFQNAFRHRLSVGLRPTPTRIQTGTYYQRRPMRSNLLTS